MGLIPYRVLNEAIHTRDAHLTCDCGKAARFVGLFVVVTAQDTLVPEALFLCGDCAAQVDPGVELHSLRKKAIRAEIEHFALTRRSEPRQYTRMSTEEQKRRRAESERKRREQMKAEDIDAYRERMRGYQRRYAEKKRQREQQRMVGDD